MTLWKKPRRMSWLLALTLGTTLGAISVAGTAHAAIESRTPEQRTLEAARLIKPMSDTRWKEVAAAQLNEEYEIIKGDTLWGISQRLFAEGNYWPKLWALNGTTIANPHWIKPGAKLTFNPGTVTSLPTLALQGATAEGATETATDVPAPAVIRKGRSTEWRDLPLQSWEEVQIDLPPNVDPQGFDMSKRYSQPVTSGFDLRQVAASAEIPVLASVKGANKQGLFFTLGDTVFLEPEKEDSLQAGKVYVLTRDPSTLKQSLFARSGLAYAIDGLVEVIGQKNGSWVGKLTRSSGPVERSRSVLVDIPVRFTIPAPVAAPEGIEATLLLERGSSTSLMAQHHFAFIDRGSDDGVRPGMVFRAFVYKDLETGKSLTGEDIAYSGDCTVVHVTERFSTVLITSSTSTLDDGMSVKALTDVSGLARARKSGIKELDGTPAPKPRNDLDELEGSANLTEEEKKNLKQLEKKKEGDQAEPSPETSPNPEASPAPETPAEGELPPADEPPPNLEETPTAPAPETPPNESATSPSPGPTPTPTPTAAPAETPAEPAPSEESAPEAPPEF